MKDVIFRSNRKYTITHLIFSVKNTFYLITQEITPLLKLA